MAASLVIVLMTILTLGDSPLKKTPIAMFPRRPSNQNYKKINDSGKSSCYGDSNSKTYRKRIKHINAKMDNH